MNYGIYLASAYANYDQVKAWAALFRSHNRDIISTWHDLPKDSEGDPPRGDARRGVIARRCMSEVRRCSTLVFFDSCFRSRGGLIEAGAVLADPRKRVIWVQLDRDHFESANAFDALPYVKVVTSREQLLAQFNIREVAS